MNSPTDPATSMDQDLDAEISSIRTEIRNLQKHRRFLSTSLLSSTHIQDRLQSQHRGQNSNKDISPLVDAAGKHAATNFHRIGFSTTAFPFKDPSPNPSQGSAGNANLLGVRVDVCGRDGRYAQPYYVLLKKVAGKEKEKRVRVHRHTIPAFISLDKLERVYLPCPGLSMDTAEDGDGDDAAMMKPWKEKGRRRKQDLRGFVREVRRELVAWQMRRDALDFLKERLGLEGSVGDTTVQQGEGRLADSLGIASLSSTALDARYFRLQWEDGRLGLLRVSNAGTVDRAVVMGDAGRNKGLELALTGGDGRVESLLDRLTEWSSRRGT
ncbi:hypothetical protein PHISP_04901 [Aspergillus sp. HF37]|nr:hypothetical protein PHISP_04901 [Aspergillus sp. HF37]